MRTKSAEIDWWAEERAARERGFSILAGVDEVGLGPIAGPVVAAAVVLPYECAPQGVNDSKALTAEQRESLDKQIRECAIALSIAIVDVPTLDSINILRASHQAMREAVGNLGTRPDVALIDGRPVQPFPVPQIALIKGDARSASIAAASIVAKVERDKLMCDYDAAHPGYGFAIHKGYSTEDHQARLRELGPCPIHRRSFQTVAGLCQTELPLDENQVTGQTGESVTAAYLQDLGWQILASRFRCYGGEVDLIAKDGSTLAFVEVKSRRGKKFGSAAESVDKRKRQRLMTAVNFYLSQTGSFDCLCRFDVAEVQFGRDGLASVNLIQNAFFAVE